RTIPSSCRAMAARWLLSRLRPDPRRRWCGWNMRQDALLDTSRQRYPGGLMLRLLTPILVLMTLLAAFFTAKAQTPTSSSTAFADGVESRELDIEGTGLALSP